MECPVKNIDLLTPTSLENPFSIFKKLRRETPVLYSPNINMYLISKYEDIDCILSDPELFSAANVSQPIQPMCPEAAGLLGPRFNPQPMLAGCDPPRHTIQRRSVRKALNPKLLREIGVRIRGQAEQLIDDMIKKTEFDLVADLASPLTASIGLDAAGYPLEDMESFLRWNANRVVYIWGHTTLEEQKQIAQNIRTHWEYAEDRVKFLWDQLDDSIISELIRAHKEQPEELSVDEVVSAAFALVTASHETTTNAITNGIYNLMRYREQWHKLCDDPSLVANAVEEALRFEGSVTSWRRRAKKATVISGVPIPEGADLLLLFGSANRDPDKFEDPESFDIMRNNAKEHLTFGKGIHMCSGMQLARTQMQAVFEILSQKAPDLMLVKPQDVEYSPNIALHGPLRLMMRLGG